LAPKFELKIALRSALLEEPARLLHPPALLEEPAPLLHPPAGTAQN